MPANPLEDTGAAERWLQQVQLLQQQGEMHREEDGTAGASLESNKGDDSPQGCQEASTLQRGQICQQDETNGTHDAFAEANEASAFQSANNAKLAETDILEETEGGGEPRAKEDLAEDNFISSAVTVEQEKTPEKKGEARELSTSLEGHNAECMEIDDGNFISSAVTVEQEKTPEKKGEARELSTSLEGHNAECMEIDDAGEDETLEREGASPRLLEHLETKQEQLLLEEHQEDAAEDRKRQDPGRLEEEGTKVKQMEADFQQRLCLDDVGKQGLSPEHAAALWNLLEGRTAAAAVALSETLRLVLQPTANGAWEGGYRSALWNLLEGRTAAAAVALSETLRLVLQPTANGAWEGGYRSGKKLSLRRVLAYVASSQRDDRLWLRRRRPQGFQYRVLVGIDCSSSMQQLNAAPSALEAVVLLAQAFNHLQLAIHELDQDTSSNSSNTTSMALILSDGRFNKEQARPWVNAAIARGCIPLLLILDPEPQHQKQQASDGQAFAPAEVAVTDMLQLAIHELDQDTSSNSSHTTSMALILSDGRFNKEQARPWVNAAIARGCIPLLLILDPEPQHQKQQAPDGQAFAPPHSSSIFDLKQVQQLPGGGMETKTGGGRREEARKKLERRADSRAEQ
ncbi:Midasin, related [Eimeria praecox]|uniref:Midasin, related n=1 Tax=Eimeria praecox TaxID=51316 RepID=U6G808_9EIME|nr:Midasin, related [Eimeria praecox]